MDPHEKIERGAVHATGATGDYHEMTKLFQSAQTVTVRGGASDGIGAHRVRALINGLSFSFVKTL